MEDPWGVTAPIVRRWQRSVSGLPAHAHVQTGGQADRRRDGGMDTHTLPSILWISKNLGLWVSICESLWMKTSLNWIFSILEATPHSWLMRTGRRSWPSVFQMSLQWNSSSFRTWRLGRGAVRHFQRLESGAQFCPLFQSEHQTPRLSSTTTDLPVPLDYARAEWRHQTNNPSEVCGRKQGIYGRNSKQQFKETLACTARRGGPHL